MITDGTMLRLCAVPGGITMLRTSLAGIVMLCGLGWCAAAQAQYPFDGPHGRLPQSGTISSRSNIFGGQDLHLPGSGSITTRPNIFGGQDITWWRP